MAHGGLDTVLSITKHQPSARQEHRSDIWFQSLDADDAANDLVQPCIDPLLDISYLLRLSLRVARVRPEESKHLLDSRLKIKNLRPLHDPPLHNEANDPSVRRSLL